MRLVAERALTRQGYEVTSASDGEEGLEIVQQGGEFDLVISDVVMPVMDGPAMAREIRKLAPALPVLFMSGYAEEQLRKDIDIENMHFIPKRSRCSRSAKRSAKCWGLRRSRNARSKNFVPPCSIRTKRIHRVAS